MLFSALGALAGTATATAGAAAGGAASAAGAAGVAGGVASGVTGGASAVGAAGGVAGAAGTALSAIGTGMGILGQFKQQAAAKKAEELRERQMNLESSRQKRQIVRQAILARSESLASATSQGAQFGSGLAGGQAQITGTAAQGVLGVNQNTEIGRGIFQANREMASAQTMSSFGQGLQGAGGSLVNNMEMYGRLGAYYGYRG